MLPPDHYARCTLPGCSWHVNTPDPAYRDTLATQHSARYGHATERTDYP